jgi:hypothetical protein
VTVNKADSIFRRAAGGARRRAGGRAGSRFAFGDCLQHHAITSSPHPQISAMPWDFVSVYKTKCLDFQVDARDVIINALELEQLRCTVS